MDDSTSQDELATPLGEVLDAAGPQINLLTLLIVILTGFQLLSTPTPVQQNIVLGVSLLVVAVLVNDILNTIERGIKSGRYDDNEIKDLRWLFRLIFIAYLFTVPSIFRLMGFPWVVALVILIFPLLYRILLRLKRRL